MVEELELHSSISNVSAQREIAELLKKSGWEIRKCTWHDYEATRDDYEIIIEKNSKGLILVHGTVDESSFDEIKLTFLDNKLNFEMELYRADELIKTANKR